MDEIIDLTVLLGEEYPVSWPGGGFPFRFFPGKREGMDGLSYSEYMIIAEHTGTHWDAPAHFVAPPSSGRDEANIYGTITAERVPPWMFTGEAIVVDARSLLDKGKRGKSPIITIGYLKKKLKANVRLEGKVVLFNSGYHDKYFKQLPEGKRLVHEPLEGIAKAWPAPDERTTKYLVRDCKVKMLGNTAPSLGPVSRELDVRVHQVGLAHGAIYCEQLVGCGAISEKGSFFAFLAPKFQKGSGGPGRAIGIRRSRLAQKLIQATASKNVVDMTLSISEKMPSTWPGVGVGDYHAPFVSKTLNKWSDDVPALSKVNFMPTRIGSCLVSPGVGALSSSLESPALKKTWRRFQRKFKVKKLHYRTVDHIGLNDLMGYARVIDVRHLLGKIPSAMWPASPSIGLDVVQGHERLYGRLEPGEVVIFLSGYSDRFYLSPPYHLHYMHNGLRGKEEGWPVPEPEVIFYLARRGIKTIGTDSPRMGSCVAEKAMLVYWAAASTGVNLIEGLCQVSALPPRDGFFIFGPLKIENALTSPGGAVGFLI